MRHARKVAEIARSLFDALQPLHQLPLESGKLLEAAAYLHDTGHYVNDAGHHKHSYYLVANSDLPAFTSREREFIATCAGTIAGLFQPPPRRSQISEPG